MLDELADKLLEAQLALDEAKERFEEAKADFIEEAKRAGKYDSSLKAAGNARIKLTPNRFFDVKEAEKFLTKKTLKECTVPTLDPKLVKAHLTPIQLEEAMRTYSNPFKLSVSVLED